MLHGVFSQDHSLTLTQIAKEALMHFKLDDTEVTLFNTCEGRNWWNLWE